MTSEWTPIVVAVVSGLLLIPPALLGIVAGRGEPRRLKELRALNDVLQTLPENDDSHAALATYRTAIAQAYSERPTRIDPGLIVLSPLVVGWMLSSGSLFVIESRGRPVGEVVDASVVWLANVCMLLGLIIICIGLVFAVLWGSGFVVRAWRHRHLSKPMVGDRGHEPRPDGVRV